MSNIDKIRQSNKGMLKQSMRNLEIGDFIEKTKKTKKRNKKGLGKIKKVKKVKKGGGGRKSKQYKKKSKVHSFKNSSI